MKITPKSLQEIGFINTASYDHDQWHTEVYRNNEIKVFITQLITGGDISVDVEIEETQELFLTLEDLTNLSKIINKNKTFVDKLTIKECDFISKNIQRTSF